MRGDRGGDGGGDVGEGSGDVLGEVAGDCGEDSNSGSAMGLVRLAPIRTELSSNKQECCVAGNSRICRVCRVLLQLLLCKYSRENVRRVAA